jgi:hypothetical protein
MLCHSSIWYAPCITLTTKYLSAAAKKKCCDEAPPVMAQQCDDAVYKSPVAKKKRDDQAPPDTDATLPVPTLILAIQAEEL